MKFHNEKSMTVSLMSRDRISRVSSLPTVNADQENNYGDQRAAKRRTSEPAVN